MCYHKASLAFWAVSTFRQRHPWQYHGRIYLAIRVNSQTEHLDRHKGWAIARRLYTGFIHVDSFVNTKLASVCGFGNVGPQEDHCGLR